MFLDYDLVNINIKVYAIMALYYKNMTYNHLLVTFPEFKIFQCKINASIHYYHHYCGNVLMMSVNQVIYESHLMAK